MGVNIKPSCVIKILCQTIELWKKPNFDVLENCPENIKICPPKCKKKLIEKVISKLLFACVIRLHAKPCLW